MISYVTGNILDTSAQYIVNTVNCEGYMGKGLAYQIKLAYPNNNRAYVQACRNGEFRIGRLHYFKENGKIIINFPTKNKWREKSKMEYIEKGLDELLVLIKKLNIKSIAIPPLGSGNGGLIWGDVKRLIEKKMKSVSAEVQILIYEPSENYVVKSREEPKLSFSAMILMLMEINLKKYDKLRLQKTAYFFNFFSNQNYFKFSKYKYGPYDNAIDIIVKKIEEFKDYYSETSTLKAYEIAYRKHVSKNFEEKINGIMPAIKSSCEYVDLITLDKNLECITTILFLIENNQTLTTDEIIVKFLEWSEEKVKRFTKEDVMLGIQYLYDTEVIEKNLLGYSVFQKNNVYIA